MIVAFLFLFSLFTQVSHVKSHVQCARKHLEKKVQQNYFETVSIHMYLQNLNEVEWIVFYDEEDEKRMKYIHLFNSQIQMIVGESPPQVSVQYSWVANVF